MLSIANRLYIAVAGTAESLLENVAQSRPRLRKLLSPARVTIR